MIIPLTRWMLALLCCGVMMAAATSVRANHVPTVPPVSNGLAVWYEPDDPDGVTLSGGRVSAMTDQLLGPNSLAQDAVQTNVALQPLLAPSGINGRAAIHYDTNNRFLATAGPIGVGGGGGFTYFLVVQPQAFTLGGVGDGGGSYFMDRTTASNALVSLKAVADNRYGFQVRYDDGSGLGGPTSASTISTSGPQIITLRRNFDGVPGGGNDFFEIYVNNVLEGATPDSGANLTPPDPQFGRHATFADLGVVGMMGDVLIYHGALTPQEMTATYAYLEGKYIPEPSGFALVALAALARRTRRLLGRDGEVRGPAAVAGILDSNQL